MPNPIAQRLATLPKLSKTELADLWREIFKALPPSQLRRRLMIPILAYRLQEQTFGGVSTRTCGRLNQLARALESSSDGAIAPIPSLKPGTRLVRQWRDQVHLVNVEAENYEYQGARYQSLSEIARLITGTRWSGPLFFGLKNDAKANHSQEAERVMILNRLCTVPFTLGNHRKKASNNPLTRSMHSEKLVRLLSLASVMKAGECCLLAMTMVDTPAELWSDRD
jgi:DUF2924 family protein